MDRVFDVIMRVVSIAALAAVVPASIWMMLVLWRSRGLHRDLSAAVKETREGLSEIVAEDIERNEKIAKAFSRVEAVALLWERRARRMGWRDGMVDD
jgi:hypothetical protein